MRLLAITQEQQNIFATHITLGMTMSGQKLFNANFDVYVAFVQYTSRTLFVDFRFFLLERLQNSVLTYSKYRYNNLPEVKM